MMGKPGLFDRILRRPAVRIADLGTVDGPVYAVGDVHGCSGLLDAALAGIAEDAAGFGTAPTVILLGDMVDRGPDSAGVLERLAKAGADGAVRAVLGNHERMMLSFLADPVRAAGWLDEGGYETLLSYGLSLPPDRRGDARRLRRMLDAHIPDDHRAWLGSLPHGVGCRIDAQRYLFVHAGIDAARGLDRQDESALLWGRGTAAPCPGLCVVQGHVIVERPLVETHRICIDTGAFRSGILTVLRLARAVAPTLMSFGRHV